MQQETARAVVLLIRALIDGPAPEDLRELKALGVVLLRSSRAAARRPLNELEATAGGKPQPEDT